MLKIIIFIAIAGICGTGLGGIISVLLFIKLCPQNQNQALSPKSVSSHKWNELICWLLSFAAGVMISIVCFGLIPESIALTSKIKLCPSSFVRPSSSVPQELADTLITILGLILGIVVVMTLNRIVDRINKIKDKLYITQEDLYHERKIIINQKKMFRSGFLMFFAIGLHNLPEGIAIGAGGTYDFQFGMLLATMIALHNIPEGMAIAAPLLAGGVSKWRVIVLTALSGAPTLFGGLLGLVIGNVSDFAIAMCLSVAGGAMLYVVFGEIIPQAVVMTKNRIATIIVMFGIIFGFIVTQFHH